MTNASHIAEVLEVAAHMNYYANDLVAMLKSNERLYYPGVRRRLKAEVERFLDNAHEAVLTDSTRAALESELI